MKTTARRGYAVLLLVVFVLGGLSLLGFRFAVNGERWATLRANEHLNEAGSFIAAGNITDRNGELLASTVGEDRVYSDSERIRRSTLHIVGDTEGYIASGVQTAYKRELTGYNPIIGIYSLKRYGRGNDVKLTIDSQTSAVAYDALKGRKGVVAAYNYKTGELLCAVSSPNYDIDNKPTSEQIDENKDGKYDGLYINRLIDGLYTPGSTFKIITTACVAENISDISSWSYKCTGEEVIDGVKIVCPKAHGEMNFNKCFANSCNCAYAVLSQTLGADKLTRTAESFGFGKAFPFGNAQTSASTFDVSGAGAADLAWASVGQYTTLANPYHMLTVLGAIANKGEAVLPYAVAQITTPDGKVVESTEATTESYISGNIAETVKEMMRFNVKTKYGDDNFKGLNMCGKTGTAEIEDGKEPHSWFMGFSADSDCPVAIVVVVENGGWGSAQALPVASEVMTAVYKSLS